jgi:hypothetical protein
VIEMNLKLSEEREFNAFFMHEKGASVIKMQNVTDESERKKNEFYALLSYDREWNGVTGVGGISFPSFC